MFPSFGPPPALPGTASPRLAVLTALTALAIVALRGDARQAADAARSADIPAAAASTHSAGPASVTIASPRQGSAVGPKVRVVVKVSGFRIDGSYQGEPRSDVGHLHFSMDNGSFDFPRYSGKNGHDAAKWGTQGRFSPAFAPTITYDNLPPGRHTLRVALANSAHLETDVHASVSFRVK